MSCIERSLPTLRRNGCETYGAAAGFGAQ